MTGGKRCAGRQETEVRSQNARRVVRFAKGNGPERSSERRVVGSRRGKITERTQEVVVAQQDTILGSENEPKSHGTNMQRSLKFNHLFRFWLRENEAKSHRAAKGAARSTHRSQLCAEARQPPLHPCAAQGWSRLPYGLIHRGLRRFQGCCIATLGSTPCGVGLLISWFTVG